MNLKEIIIIICWGAIIIICWRAIFIRVAFLLKERIKEHKAKKTQTDKETTLVDYIVSKHQNGEINWKPCETYTSSFSYNGYLDTESITIYIFTDNTCWIRFENIDQFTLKSDKFSKLKIIMQDIIKQKNEPEPLTGIDKVISKLNIEKVIYRDNKINKVLQDESIIQKVKRVFITKDI